eukprot:gene4546-6417_t
MNNSGSKDGITNIMNNLNLNPGHTAEVRSSAHRPTLDTAPKNTDINITVAVDPNKNENEVKASEISAPDRRELRNETINYDAQKMIGHGSFGAVFLAKVVETDEMVAIKKVLQDKRFKNRELQIMRQLAKQQHPYIVTLKHHFNSKGSKNDDVYLNLVLEYVPETIYSIAKYFNRRKETTPIFSIKLYMYQLSRALAHIHGMGICHRDIKPHNLLVDPVRQVLKLCDFGSAKAFVKGEPNVAYICSRFYRAPELIFGSTDYHTAIDVWSQGCVFAELLLGAPIFPGSSGIDQLVEIIKVLGTPTKDQLKSMNPNYQEFKFPTIRANPLAGVFKPSTPADALDLISKLLDYVPDHRLKAIEACVHPFFNELRLPSTTMPDGSPLQPELFLFTNEELTVASTEVLNNLIPPHLAAEKHVFIPLNPSTLYPSSLSPTPTSANGEELNGNGAIAPVSSVEVVTGSGMPIVTTNTATSANNTATSGKIG